MTTTTAAAAQMNADDVVLTCSNSVQRALFSCNCSLFMGSSIGGMDFPASNWDHGTLAAVLISLKSGCAPVRDRPYDLTRRAVVRGPIQPHCVPGKLWESRCLPPSPAANQATAAPASADAPAMKAR